MELCVCAEPLRDHAEYPCGHQLCVDCTLKKRVLQKDRACPYCRAEAAKPVVVPEDGHKEGEGDWYIPQAHVTCATPEIQASIRHILRFPCPICDREQKTYSGLKEHVGKAHRRTVCDICTKHELVFSPDYTLRAPGEVQKHLRERHVKCRFCHKYFYGSDEFAAHCRAEHVGCHVCERQNPDRPLYFENYDRLLEHFRSRHYMCPVQSCLEDRFIVFGTDLELQHHLQEQHRGLKIRGLIPHPTNLDDEPTANGRSRDRGRDSHEDPAAAAAHRYTARLEIDAKHDANVVAQINQANITFGSKPVPVGVHVATYERLLPAATPREITTLLEEFARSNLVPLDGGKRRELTVTLAQRHHREEQEARASNASGAGSGKSGGPGKRAPQSQSTPMVLGWSSQVVATPHAGAGGPGALDNLPTLPTHGRPAYLNRPLRQGAAKSANYRGLLRTPLQGDLPTLGSRRAQPTLGAGPQTSVPTRERSRPTPWESAYVPTRDLGSLRVSSESAHGPAAASSPNSPSPAPSTSSSPGPSSSAGSSRPSSSSISGGRIPANLPSLNSRPKPGAKAGTGKKKVLRMI